MWVSLTDKEVRLAVSNYLAEMHYIDVAPNALEFDWDDDEGITVAGNMTLEFDWD